VFLDERFKLLEYVAHIDICDKVLDDIHGQRVYHSQFQVRGVVAKPLFCVLVRRSSRDYTNFLAVDFLVGIFGVVYVDFFREFFKVAHTFFDYGVSCPCHRGYHNPFRDILFVWYMVFHTFACFDYALRV
jgi:hypothetical protein